MEKSMSILQQAGARRQPDFDVLKQQFSGGLAALARRAGLEKNEVESEAWLAWQAEKGKGVGWWWARLEKAVLRQAIWWTGGPMWSGGPPARLVPLEAAEFEVVESAEIERWRGPEGDALVISDTGEIAARLGISRRRAQQKVASAVKAIEAQSDLFFSGVEK
jgi:hypothetical protein